MFRRRKSQRLTPVTRLAKDREDRAAATLGECAREVQAQEQRLAELEAFRREYGERFERLGSDGMGVDRLNEYRRFMGQLDQAVEQQRRLVEERRQQLDRHNWAWTERRARRRALDKLVDRARVEEHREVEAREQRETDERAQRTGSAPEDD